MPSQSWARWQSIFRLLRVQSTFETELDDHPPRWVNGAHSFVHEFLRKMTKSMWGFRGPETVSFCHITTVIPGLFVCVFSAGCTPMFVELVDRMNPRWCLVKALLPCRLTRQPWYGPSGKNKGPLMTWHRVWVPRLSAQTLRSAKACIGSGPGAFFLWCFRTLGVGVGAVRWYMDSTDQQSGPGVLFNRSQKGWVCIESIPFYTPSLQMLVSNHWL